MLIAQHSFCVFSLGELWRPANRQGNARALLANLQRFCFMPRQEQQGARKIVTAVDDAAIAATAYACPGISREWKSR